MYSTHNERKSILSERFIRALENKIYKHMTSVSENVYMDKLDDIVHQYNKTYYGTIKMKSVGVKSSTYIDLDIEKYEKDPKFEVGDHVKSW